MMRSRRSFEEEIVILSVGKPWSIADEASKTYNAGATMWYVNAPDVYDKWYDEDTGTVGNAPIKQTMPPEFYEYVKSIGLPAKAVGTFVQRNKSGGMVLVLSGVRFLEATETYQTSEEPEQKEKAAEKKGK